jgi:hypothetical protein
VALQIHIDPGTVEHFGLVMRTRALRQGTGTAREWRGTRARDPVQSPPEFQQAITGRPPSHYTALSAAMQLHGPNGAVARRLGLG